MKTQKLACQSPFHVDAVPQIVENLVHRGKTLLYVENLPAWELFEAKILSLATRTYQASKTDFAYTDLVAAVALELPTAELPLQLDLLFFDKVRRSSSKVGVLEGRGGIDVHRHLRRYPNTCRNFIKGLPILDTPYLLAEFLSKDRLEQALMLGDALVRKTLKCTHSLSPAQLAAYAELKATTLQVANEFLPKRLRKLVSSRLCLLNPLAESPLESKVRAFLIEAGITEISLQFPIFTEGSQYYADIFLPTNRLIIECDGSGKYAFDPDKTSEKRRQLAIENLGLQVLRVSWEQAHDYKFMQRLVQRLNK
ncbi:hypothetical protein HMPREF0044_0763 [Gleimia coleocanis DSM 15436]|uniref:DUF559 domain-containing protein n=1 Tax=Gleimia coleocanis DSM 15436 TaxID=525245 RepID=C0W120_9ACTO|nr:hypothetical protein [Gleimia coleocanis]EEH63744.1 hypothetical protein HMPREF0044_0763 [Gleimia coleocanis DSM 15436]